QFFPNIMDYNFTARIEREFDDVAQGAVEWNKLIFGFYEKFNPEVDNALHVKAEHKVGERELGKDPVSGKPVFAKIGRYGPVVQIGSATDEEKPHFAQMKKGQSLETITLEEALKLFALPRTLREFEGLPIIIGSGRFGAYVQHNNKYVSIPKGMDPLTINLEEASKLILDKRKVEQEKHLRTFDEDPKMEILNGRFGPYISYNDQNYRLPKSADPKTMTYQECMNIIAKASDKTKPATKKVMSRKNKGL
ncbi:MAG: DNA topoisomerase I, partial [Bacteroidaceae bacterium]|nr:DNA topoisomerase I [Bacteroidaceae bacterium]